MRLYQYVHETFDEAGLAFEHEVDKRFWVKQAVMGELRRDSATVDG